MTAHQSKSIREIKLHRSRSVSASAPVFRIPKQFRIDESGIPGDKLNDPRLIDAEANINFCLADETDRLQICLHEAAHAVYFERADLRCILLGPSISYDQAYDKFDKANATVHPTHFISSGTPLVYGQWSIPDSELDRWARWSVAGGVVKRRLTNSDNGGDESDKKYFFSEGRQGGMPEDEIQRLWDQAQADVEKDLRSPAFRHQVWDRAREFKSEFDSKYKYVETLPEYFVVALDDIQETLDGNGNVIESSCLLRVLEVRGELEAA